jgi:hypothetical protein
VSEERIKTLFLGVDTPVHPLERFKAWYQEHENPSRAAERLPGALPALKTSSNEAKSMQKTSERADLTASQQAIAAECDALKAFLLEKNRKYGDSALHPRRFLSRANAVEQLKVRIDDKLNRLCNAAADEDEDVVLDLIGYLVILRVAAKLPQ